VSTSALASMAIRTGRSLAAKRLQPMLGLALAAIPLAERMLLYHVAMTAWIMLPERGLLEKTLLSCCGRMGLGR